MNNFARIRNTTTTSMFNKNTQVSEIMTTEVMCVEPSTTLDTVSELFEENEIHHIPVVDKGKVVGMISTIDVRRAEHHFTLFKTQSAQQFNKAILRSLLAQDLMSHPVATIRDSDSVNKAASMFRENLIRALPVLDASQNLVGIITPYDLMNYAYPPYE